MQNDRKNWIELNSIGVKWIEWKWMRLYGGEEMDVPLECGVNVVSSLISCILAVSDYDSFSGS